MNKTMEVVLLSRCNFSCDYCIAGSNVDPFVINKQTKKREYIKSPESLASDLNGDAIIVPVTRGFSKDDTIRIIGEGKVTEREALSLKDLKHYVQKNLAEWTIVISGGEPLLYPNLDKHLNEISKTNDIILLTNASKVQEHLELLQNPKVFWRIGYHPEYRSLDEFYENMEFVKKHTNNYVVNYVHHPRHRRKDKDQKYIDFLKEHDFKYEISPFKGSYKDKEYSYDSGFFDPSWLSSHFIDEVPDQEKILPGKSFLTMYGDGYLYSCHAKTEIQGQLQSEEFQIKQNGFKPRCLENKCNCDSMRSYKYIEENWSKSA